MDVVWTALLSAHVLETHLDAMRLPELCADADAEKYPDRCPRSYVIAYYVAAIGQREQRGMPALGVSVDRRAFRLLATVYNSALCGASSDSCARK